MSAAHQSTANDRTSKEEKYERILDAALSVFSRKGFHEAKVTEIAHAAGVADGTIYLYFKNKDDLLISLFEAKLEEINTDLRRALVDAGSASNKVECFIRHHLKSAERDPTLTAFITVELRRSAKFIKDYAKSQLAEYLDQLGAAIDEGKASGEFRSNLSTGIVKQIIFGALDHVCQIWVTNPQRRPGDLAEVATQLTELVGRAISARS